MIAAIVLAAGASTRFGGQKLLAPWNGEPLVRHSVARVLSFDLAPVVVVLGHGAAAVRDALTGLDIVAVVNPDPDRGQASSVGCGLGALPADADAAFVFLADQPNVDKRAVDAVRAALDPDALAVAPTYAGVRANPVAFPRAAWSELRDLVGDDAIRRHLDTHGDRVVLVPAPGSVPFDIDTRSDLAGKPQALQRFRGGAGYPSSE